MTWNDEKPSSAAACAHQPSPSMFFGPPYDGQRTPDFWGDELPFAPSHLGPKSESAATASTLSHEELDAEPMSEERR